MNKDFFIFQGYIVALGFVQSIGICDLNFDKVMSFSVALSQAIEYALGAVRALTAVAVELILPRLMLRAHPIVFAPLSYVNSLVQAHYLSYLVIHHGRATLLAHDLHILRLVNGQVAIIAKEGVVILAVLGRLVLARNTKVDLCKKLTKGILYISLDGLVIYLNLGLHCISQKGAVTVINQILVLEHITY